MNILGERKKKLADRSSNPARTTLLGAVGNWLITNRQPVTPINDKLQIIF